MKKILLPLIILNSINMFAEDSNKNTSYIDLLIQETNDYRKYIHQTLVDTSSSIDNYYFDKKELEKKEYNSTYALLELSAYQNQGEGLSFDQKIRIKLKLPKLRDSLKLVFESDEERETKDFIENHDNKKNDDYNLALVYNQFLNYDIDFKTRVGIKLRSKIDPFIKTEIKKTWENIYGINYTISQAVKESVDKKLELTSYIRLDKKLAEDYTIHNYNEYYNRSENNADSEFYHSVYLNQRINPKNLLTYTIDTNIDNIESNLKIKRYSAKVRYRHFINKWLYTDVIPENYYKEEQNFKSKYAIRFNLGMFFNKDSYR